mmetsp:Transcript_14515/g.28607  ORF Transcript_14515/g.28607 Transcript_14515/m.28607 type:complete len:242 (-) Transcript_14515:107-832(-)
MIPDQCTRSRKLYLSHIVSFIMPYLLLHSLPFHHSSLEKPKSLSWCAKHRATASLSLRPLGRGASQTRLYCPMAACSVHAVCNRSMSFAAMRSAACNVAEANSSENGVRATDACLGAATAGEGDTLRDGALSGSGDTKAEAPDCCSSSPTFNGTDAANVGSAPNSRSVNRLPLALHPRPLALPGLSLDGAGCWFGMLGMAASPSASIGSLAGASLASSDVVSRCRSMTGPAAIALFLDPKA